MKLHIRLGIFCLFLLGVSLACKWITNSEPVIQTAPSGMLEFTMPTPTLVVDSCPAITGEAIRLALEQTNPGKNMPSKENVFLVSYSLADDQLDNATYNSTPEVQKFKKYQIDRLSHEVVWNYFRVLIPPEQRSFLTEFIIITDGGGNLLAAVKQTPDDPEKWALLVDYSDTDNPYELTYTLIHEFAHLLTLNPNQVPPSMAIFKHPDDRDTYFQELAACFTYFPGEGCSNPDSYIDDFYNQFWLDIYDEWNKIEFEPDEDEYIDSMEAFYAKYKTRFVTDYAVTRPAEDIAETFAFFVLGRKPAGNTIAEKKVLFFYDHPELVSLRETILKNVCQNFPK